MSVQREITYADIDCTKRNQVKEKMKKLETNAFRPHSFYWMKLDRIKTNLKPGEFVVMTKLYVK